MLNFIKKIFTRDFDRSMTIEENWLSQSTDLADLERRQKMLSRGQAPWQIRANANLKGWV